MTKHNLTTAQLELLERICGPDSKRNPRNYIWDGIEQQVAQRLVNKGLAEFKESILSYKGQGLYPTEAGKKLAA